MAAALGAGPLEGWGEPSTSSSLTAPEPEPPVGWSAPHRCSQENTFISDPKQEEVKGEGVGTRWLSTEVDLTSLSK